MDFQIQKISCEQTQQKKGLGYWLHTALIYFFGILALMSITVIINNPFAANQLSANSLTNNHSYQTAKSQTDLENELFASNAKTTDHVYAGDQRNSLGVIFINAPVAKLTARNLTPCVADLTGKTEIKDLAILADGKEITKHSQFTIDRDTYHKFEIQGAVGMETISGNRFKVGICGLQINGKEKYNAWAKPISVISSLPKSTEDN